MFGLVDYKSSGSDDDDDGDIKQPWSTPIDMNKVMTICSAPPVNPIGNADSIVANYMGKDVKEVYHNFTYEELFTPEAGPENPFLTHQQRAAGNNLAGHVEKAHMNEFQFEDQRRTFNTCGFALDPSIKEEISTEDRVICRLTKKAVPIPPTSTKCAFEKITKTEKKSANKRKKDKNDDASDIDGFKGPWAPYVDEKRNVKPSPEEAAELEEYLAKKQKRGRRGAQDQKIEEEKSVMHIKDTVDYQGRSFLHPPQDTGVNLKAGAAPSRCHLPKNHIHTWEGHTKGISCIRWFPVSAHLLLSSGMDGRVKLWEVFNQRRCIQTYYGHRQAVRDVNFNNAGTQFLSAGYDRYIKLWDTETGACVSRFTNHKVPYCVKFNPDNDKQHLFVVGTSDKKIICWDTRSNEIVQEYDRHLGAVNTITFIDENRRFITTSDDKSLRVWEWDIPVDVKYIADPAMHSMPAVTLSPNNKWLACQSMENKIVIFTATDRFKMSKKKKFEGHMVAGYACSIDFSPDMKYIMSGDADGRCFIWDWKTMRRARRFKAHNSVCIATLWHPHETSKIATAGWDGLIKYWD